MKNGKFLALILAILMVSVLFVSCGNGTDDPAKTTAGADATGGETEPIETEDPTVVFEIPENHTLNRPFVLYTWSNQTQWEWDAESQNGEKINDAIFNRRQKTEELLGITIEIEKQVGDWDNRSSFIAKLEANVSTNTHAFDAVSQYTPAAAIGALKLLYVDLKDIDTLHLEKKWWPGDITESAAVNDRLYFVTGDITPTLIRNMSCVMANLELANSYDLPDLYELVDNKQWTLDKFIELSTDKVAALNGNGEEAYYGITISNNVTYDGLFYSGGFRFVEEDADGILKMSPDLAGNDLIDWYEKCQNAIVKHDDVAILAINKAFTAGHAIFHMGQSSDIQNYLRDVSFKSAVLPFPIYKEGEAYHTISGYWCSMFSIPTDAQNLDESGIALETLGYYGYEIITPAFYTESFQYKYLDGPDNARMFDLLHDTMTYDTGRFYADAINCFAAFRQACNDGVSWTSWYASHKSAWEAGVKNVYNTLG